MKLFKNLRSTCRNLCATAAALLAAAGFSACSSDPAEILPDDICGLVRVDVKSIADKAGLAERPEVKDLKDKFLEEVEGDLSKSSCERLREMLDDPAEFGFDLRKPVYFFGPAKSFAYCGMAAAVHSKSKVHDFMELIVKESEDNDNFRLRDYDGLEILVDEREKVALAYDGDYALFACNYDRKESFLRDLRKRFEDKDEGSVTRTEVFKKMKSEGSDITACFLTGNALKFSESKDLIPSDAKEMLDKCRAKDYSLIAGITFADESVDAYVEVIAESDEAKKQLEENSTVFKNVEAKHFANIPKEAFLVGGLGADGAKYWDAVKKYGALDILKEEGLNDDVLAIFENIVKAVSGEATIAISAPEEGTNTPGIYGFVDVTSKAEADKAVSPVVSLYNEQVNARNEEYSEYGWYTPRALVQDAGDGTFSVVTHEPTEWNPQTEVLFFGTKGNTFFISNTDGVSPDKTQSASLKDAPFASRVNGTMGYAVLNVAALMANSEVRRQAEREHLSDYFDHLATVELYASSISRVEGHVFFRDLGKDKTPIAYICDIICDMTRRYM